MTGFGDLVKRHYDQSLQCDALALALKQCLEIIYYDEYDDATNSYPNRPAVDAARLALKKAGRS